MMILKYYTQALYYALLLVILVPIQFNCTNNAEDTNNNNYSTSSNQNSVKPDTDRKANYNSDEGWPFVAGFTPLSFEKYTNIREDTDSFSLIHITYANDSNYDQGIAQDYIWVSMSAGFAGKNYLLSSVENYKGSLSRDIEGLTPPNGEYFLSSFTAAQVEAIYSYLELNHEYFFNGEEYNGLTIPYDSEGAFLTHADNMFCLSFTEPGDMYYAWAIHKCMDEPNPILQGLIDIINVEFISQFE